MGHASFSTACVGLKLQHLDVVPSCLFLSKGFRVVSVCGPLWRAVLQHSCSLRLQVSFYRPNLHYKVVPKENGKDDEGRPLALEALVRYIRCACRLAATTPVVRTRRVESWPKCFSAHSIGERCLENMLVRMRLR